MGHLLRVLSLVAIVATMACSPPSLEHQGAAGPGVVGDSCQSDEDCNLDLGCIEEAPQGVCTMECSAEVPCPDGSLCIQVDSEIGTLYGCFVPCDPGAQRGDTGSCRESYECRQVGDRALHICYW